VLFSGSLVQTIGGLQQQAEPLELIFLVTLVMQMLVAQVQIIVFQTLVVLALTIAHTAQLAEPVIILVLPIHVAAVQILVLKVLLAERQTIA